MRVGDKFYRHVEEVGMRVLVTGGAGFIGSHVAEAYYRVAGANYNVVYHVVGFTRKGHVVSRYWSYERQEWIYETKSRRFISRSFKRGRYLPYSL